MGPRTELESGFADLVAAIEKPEQRKRVANTWISEATWKLVDRRAGLRRTGGLVQSEARRLGLQIKASLRQDRVTRAEDAASEVEGHLTAREVEEFWLVLKAWYKKASNRTMTPCYQMLENQTKERAKLYRQRAPPGEHFRIYVQPAEV